MIQSNSRAPSRAPKRTIAADMPILTARYPIEALLDSFRKLCRTRDDVRLVLGGRRCAEEIYSVWNHLDKHGLTDRAEFLPYYERCQEFPVKKQDCDVWISRHTPASLVTPEYLQSRLDGSLPPERKYAMFFTCFHPEKQEGNSTLMRLWLDHLKRAGYITHLVYYMYDANAVSADMRRSTLHAFDLYKEIPVRARLTGANYNGLNVHVDDWCGVEAMDAVGKLAGEFEYDIAVTNYSFMSAILDRVSAYTTKILLTHDSFVDRNRRMLEQGYPESGWVSIDRRGERIACERSDVVVAMQEHEAEGFRALVDPEKVRVVAPIFEKRTIEHRRPLSGPGERLRIGYFGSSNWVNEQNLGEYLKHWSRDEKLRSMSEIRIAGGVCATLKDFVPRSLLSKVDPVMVGRVEDPGDFFSTCDIIINPERGGTGIKIKTLEALAHGMPVLTTAGGSVGIGSDNPYHGAEDFEDLAAMTGSLLADPGAIETLRQRCVAIYDAYLKVQRHAMNDLLGEPAKSTGDEPAAPADSAIGRSRPGRNDEASVVVPEYVRQNASDYHLDEFERFIQRVDVRGKRVLEIGSDFHLASARLFVANGAASVVTNNLVEWRSDEPMPEGVEFRVCDACELELPDQSFDIIYGIAVIEHIPDFERICATLKRVLKPGGVVYLQGCQMWPGNLGHHVWFSPDSEENLDTSPPGGDGRKAVSMQYSFADNNPIPDWAHVAMSAPELTQLLIEKGVPENHAEGISKNVYHLDGAMVGSCTNFLAASEVLDVMERFFDIEVERILCKNPDNEYFRIAREKYSQEDLRTVGLRVWMQSKGAMKQIPQARAHPRVSVVIPFYKVEPFIEDCIKSVLRQDYPDFEAIFVDDASPDSSRRIVEKYAKNDDRIRLVTHDRNQGLGPARNTGVEHAEGAYLLFLDSDDYFSSPRAVSTLVEHAQSSGCGVVIGSCDRIMTSGERLEFDRAFDRSHDGKPGSIVSGEQAFLGASFIPGGEYVPMRAWGTLIDRFLYLDSGLTYPAAEHEDLPHTPFLYYFAESVLYIPDIVITYRDRSDSISNTGWDSGKIRRQGLIWGEIRENLTRFGLEHRRGDTAVKTAEHLIMKLRQNGIRSGAEQAAFDVLEEILQDAKGDLSEGLLFYMLDSLRGILDFQKYDYTLYHRLTGPIPTRFMVKYYRQRIGARPQDHGSIPVSRVADTPAENTGPRSEHPAAENAFPDPAPDHFDTAFARNDARAQAMIKAFSKEAPKELRKFPSMLTEGDKALYFHAGKHFQFRGSIVDAGCFVGGTTMSLVQGLLQNPLLEQHRDSLEGLIRVYDLFQIDDDYILSHLKKNYPKHDFADETSFLSVFNENMRDSAPMLDVRPGDVIRSGYADEQQIEILGVDLCKALPVTDSVVRAFFPRLLENALVIQQDFIHQYHPHIHLSMLLLDDHFDRDLELKWGGSVSYRLVKPIGAGTIASRFGPDSSWFNNVPRNEMLLRELGDDMLYDENKWVILQVLGLYYWAMREQAKAVAMCREASDRFPQFEIPHEVRRLIGG